MPAGLRVHLPLTLDEYCKPSLGTLLPERNRDQVLSKHTRDELRRRCIETDNVSWIDDLKRTMDRDAAQTNPKLLTVRQAWLWMINNFVVSSVSNSLLDFSNFGFLNQPKLDKRSRFLQLRMRIGLFLSNIITLPNDPQAMGLPQTIFGIFESAISTQEDEVSRYLKIQRTTTKRGGRRRQKYFRFGDFDEKREGEILHDINDIREELAMIRKVFSEQEEVWTAAMKTMFPENWKDGRFVSPCVTPWHHPWTDRIAYRDKMGTMWDPLAKVGPKSRTPMNVEREDSFTAPRYAEHWRKIERPQAQFEQFKRRMAQLDEDAARVEASITVFLDMRAKHASMNEAHSTAVMSVAVSGFTIVTVLFTPLSFMTSLFALPITTFQAQQVKSSWGGEDAPGTYQTRYVGAWFGKHITPLAMK